MVRRLSEFAWPFSCYVWVAAPILGWLPNVHPSLSKVVVWLIASVFVIAMGMGQPKRRNARVFGWVLFGCLCVYLSHLSNVGMAFIWMTRATLVLSAAWMIAERGDFRWLRSSVLSCALFQIPVMAAQAFQVPLPWKNAGVFPWGTLMKRGALSILFGLASVWSQGIRSMGFALASISTLSWSGAVPAAARVLISKVQLNLIGWLSVAAAFFLSAPFWIPKVLIRLEAWKSVEFLRRGWLNGWGFFPLPGGFQDDAGGSAAWAHSPLFREYHSTFIDWIARTGLIGLVISFLIGAWIVKRVMECGPWSKWTLFLILFAGATQSTESFPFMAMVFLSFLIGLNQSKEEA